MKYRINDIRWAPDKRSVGLTEAWSLLQHLCHCVRYRAYAPHRLSEITVCCSPLVRKSDYSLSNRRVNYISKLAGLDGGYAGHSFRSGGSWDLYVSNVSIEAIVTMGWWKSQAVLLYLRCEKITVLKIANALKFSWFELWNAGPNVREMGGRLA